MADKLPNIFAHPEGDQAARKVADAKRAREADQGSSARERTERDARQEAEKEKAEAAELEAQRRQDSKKQESASRARNHQFETEAGDGETARVRMSINTTEAIRQKYGALSIQLLEERGFDASTRKLMASVLIENMPSRESVPELAAAVRSWNRRHKSERGAQRTLELPQDVAFRIRTLSKRLMEEHAIHSPTMGIACFLLDTHLPSPAAAQKLVEHTNETYYSGRLRSNV